MYAGIHARRPRRRHRFTPRRSMLTSPCGVEARETLALTMGSYRKANNVSFLSNSFGNSHGGCYKLWLMIFVPQHLASCV